MSYNEELELTESVKRGTKWSDPLGRNFEEENGEIENVSMFLPFAICNSFSFWLVSRTRSLRGCL